MKDEDKTRQPGSKTQNPRRLVLRKRIIKHLAVRTDVKAGLSIACDPYPGPICVSRMCTL